MFHDHDRLSIACVISDLIIRRRNFTATNFDKAVGVDFDKHVDYKLS